MSIDQKTYTVGEINLHIKGMFVRDPLLSQPVRVKGEVSNCKYHSRGHIYFTLKDEQGAISAVMFAGKAARGLRFRMRDGDKVIVTGSISVYEVYGVYQLYAEQIERQGIGDLYQQFLERKALYEEMGMFAPEYKQPIPRYAQRIGIVTSPTGAVIQDIRNVSFRRNPHVQLILYPVQVQGEGAAESIARGIRAMERLGVDVMIVGRGGGSIEDLWAFNEDIVARAIFDCTIPIISAVGHETDFTIADYVADLRAPTPSAAAELAVFDYRQTIEQLMTRRDQMSRNLSRRLASARRELSHRQARLRTVSPHNRLNEKRYRLTEAEAKLSDRMDRRLTNSRNRLRFLAESLEGRSPMKQISRGYAYVTGPDGRALRRVEQAQPGERLRIHVMDGVVLAEVLNGRTETNS